MSQSHSDDGERGRPLRRDAAANRERLLAAAVTSMMRHGTGVTLAQIASEAGVGIATLYRRYPSREALFEELQERAYRLVIGLVKEIEAMDLPGADALRLFLTRTVDHGSQLVMPYHGAPVSQLAGTSRLEGELHGRISAMVERGVRDGTVRPDLTRSDVIIFGAMIAIPLPGVEDWSAKMARQIDFFIGAVKR